MELTNMATVENLNPNIVEGFDIGNAFVNFADVKFATKVKVGKLLNVGNKRENVHQINYDGVDYIVGDGNAIMGENKYNTDGYKLCLLTAIALRGAKSRKRNIRAKVCIGLPIELHERKAEQVREIIESWGTQEIVVNGAKYTIYIVELDIFIEGAVPVLEEDASHHITIDIGGGTIDAIEWKDMSPIKYETIHASITNVYSDIAQYLNINYGGGFEASDVEEIITSGKTETTINHEKVDISPIYRIIEEFVDNVVSRLEASKFKTGQVEKISIFGGGVYTTHKYFIKHYPKAKMVDDAQFVNSKVFKLVAKM